MQIPMREIERMLNDCAKGWKIKAKKHRNWVYYHDLIYRELPLGDHGKRTNPEIQFTKVRHLVDYLGISRTCANRHFPGMFKDA